MPGGVKPSIAWKGTDTVFGFAGPIWPVNPKYPEIRGAACYPNLKALPGRPDHVGIVVAPQRVLSVLEECADGDQALAETASNPADGQPQLRRDLAVRETREVGELEDLPVLRGQLAHRFVDRLAGHGTRKVDRSRRSAQQDVLDAVVHFSKQQALLLLRQLAAGDVAERHEPRRAGIPLRFRRPHLHDDGFA